MAAEPLPEELLDLGAVLLSERSLDEVLQHALRLAGRALPSVTAASISLTRNGTVFTCKRSGGAARGIA